VTYETHRAFYAAAASMPRVAPARGATSASQYRETEILSASPARLVVLLYEHLEVCLRRAQIAMQAGQVEARVTNLAKSRAIVSELLGTLDFEQGGEIARELAQIYSFLLTELVDVGIKEDGARALKLADIVRTLGEGFREAASQVEQMSASAAQGA
jgi:flagellar secretion chaperone FliS